MNLGNKATGKPHQAIEISTLHCQQKELEHKGRQRYHHDACHAAAAVGKNTHLGTK